MYGGASLGVVNEAQVGVYSKSEIANVIYNEIRSIYDPVNSAGMQTVYYYYAQTIINTSLEEFAGGAIMPSMGDNYLSAPIKNSAEFATYSNIYAAVDRAVADRAAGINPVPDVRYFTNRSSLDLSPQDFSRGKYPPVQWAVIFGPFNNSFPNPETPWKTGGYLYLWYNERVSTQITKGLYPDAQ